MMMEVEPVLKNMLETTGQLEGRLKSLIQILDGELDCAAMRKHVADGLMGLGVLQGSLLAMRQLYPPPAA